MKNRRTHLDYFLEIADILFLEISWNKSLVSWNIQIFPKNVSVIFFY